MQNLQTLEIPHLQSDAFWLKQGGVFSDERLYLRLARERLVFEICAAPFGNGFFVSSRFFDRRRMARWHHHFFLYLLLIVLSGLPYYLLGCWWGLIVCGCFVALVWYLMRLAQIDAVKWLSRALPQIPLLGGIYESLFNPDTYFRQDTDSCYRAAVHDAVMRAIDDMTGRNGIRLLPPKERPPILAELLGNSRPSRTRSKLKTD